MEPTNSRRIHFGWRSLLNTINTYSSELFAQRWAWQEALEERVEVVKAAGAATGGVGSFGSRPMKRVFT